MRKSRVETMETRRRIVEVAAEGFRANGIHATGLADVMASAGLSHGGFYRHFESKDELVAEACEAGLTGIVDVLNAATDGRSGDDGLNAVVDAYLSDAHRDAPERGCPLASMGSELARADDNTRAAASRGYDALVDMLAKRSADQDGTEDRSRAAFALAAMVGALTLSRIIADPAASESLLEDVRQHLKIV
jgi:TetR/AcrR family transcriptional regulator, transcriptional repressor for nem operon